MAEMKIDIRSDVHQAPEDLKDVNEALDSMERKAEAAGKKLKAIGDRAAAIGKKMTLFITAPLLAAGGAAIKLAMDAEESRNLFEISMGDMVDVAEAWSAQLSDSLGVNRYESQKLIGVFNVMLKSLGQNEKAAYDMSKGLTELGYDMASFFNLEPEEAFDKLRAAITGETEPLKRLGIVVNETTIKTWALNNGLIKQGQTLDESQKIIARYNVIMEATSLAQGDLARTMDSPTNKIRILKSRVTETAIEFGMKLMPAFEDLLKVVEKGVKWFGDMSDASKSLTIKVAAVAAATGPLLIGLGKVIAIAPKVKLAVTAMTGPFGLLVIGIATAAGAIDHFVKKSIESSDKEIDAMAKYGSTISEYHEMRKKLIEDEVVTIEGWRDIFNKHGRNYARVMKAIATLPEYEELNKAWEGMTETVSESVDEMVRKIELIEFVMPQIITNAKEFSVALKRQREEMDPLGIATLKVAEDSELLAIAWDQSMGDMEQKTLDFMASIIPGIAFMAESFEEPLKRIKEYPRGIEDAIYEALGILSYLGQHSKALAYVAAIINTAQAVTRALAEYPPPLSIAMAAIQAAAGAVQIATIAEQTIPTAEEGGIAVKEGIYHLHPGELVTPPDKITNIYNRTGGGVNIFIDIKEQLDPYSADRILRKQIIPGILEALDANHMKKLWQKRLGVE